LQIQILPPQLSPRFSFLLLLLLVFLTPSLQSANYTISSFAASFLANTKDKLEKHRSVRLVKTIGTLDRQSQTHLLMFAVLWKLFL
jgi:hypothetical protein